MDNKILETYKDNHSFMRYLKRWQEDEGSFVFVPLAEILKKGGFLDEARDVCERGLAHHPDSISGKMTLSSVYYDLGRREDADRLAREILEKVPGHAEAAKYLIQRNGFQPCHHEEPRPFSGKGGRRGDPVCLDCHAPPDGGARNDNEKGTAPSPLYPLMHTKTMAEILARQGAFDEAMEIIYSLLEGDPGNAMLKKRLEELKARQYENTHNTRT